MVLISIPTTCGFATRVELKLPFVTRGEFIVVGIVLSLPLLLKGLRQFLLFNTVEGVAELLMLTIFPYLHLIFDIHYLSLIAI